MNFTKRLFQRSANKAGLVNKTASATNKYVRSALLASTATAIGAQFLWFNTDIMNSFKASFDDDLQILSIGNSSDFIDGRMKEIKIGDDEVKDTILICRVDGILYACGSKCSHFGAPLTAGYLFEDRVWCPYHLASFSVKTGFPENGP
jgi:nitrite reductase/ring-hydroxylating ferredoxin subunit